LLGAAAIVVPWFAGSATGAVLGLLVMMAGLLELAHSFPTGGRSKGSAFLGGTLSIVTGLLLLIQARLVVWAFLLFLAASFILAGGSKVIEALSKRRTPHEKWLVAEGLVNIILGVLLGLQWPFSGAQALGLYLGIHILSAGWLILVRPEDLAAAEPAAFVHPDQKLELAPHPEVARMVEAVQSDEALNRPIHRYWQAVFVATFLAIHLGRTDREWSIDVLFSTLLAVLGDLGIAILLAYGVVTPFFLAVRKLTRPLERRVWRRHLARCDAGQPPGIIDRLGASALEMRLRFSTRVRDAWRSPRAALRRGLQIGLPLTAIVVATNPVWGFSWYFNTENWATGFWEYWVEYRVDEWREHMARAAAELDRPAAEFPASPFEVVQEDVAHAEDFSFLVVGDPGEGDASQFSLVEQYLRLGMRDDVRFLVVSSDVVYPAGEIEDYESHFYLAFKGFRRPIYAVPGNHDWYDALEAFNANFLEPESARAAMRVPAALDHRLTGQVEQSLDAQLAEAERLRKLYGVINGRQRAPYFEMHSRRFSLIVVDTGILKTVDEDQFRWLGEALQRAGDRFKFVILGHPLYAGGRYQAADLPEFGRIHTLLREHQVDAVMGGDTHDFEHYREVYEASGQTRSMHHFVNGGGGAYLSIGTCLDWPVQPPAEDCAYYPSRMAVVAKLDAETPRWKQPLWQWVKRLRAWPSSPEAVASAFDFNRAPFFQSFMEVRVDGKADTVHFLLHGAHGPVRWDELERVGDVVPLDQKTDSPVDFVLPLPPAPAPSPSG
jgi:uncharacterized membrane protein HdeD (DUF308 family)/3',5'-cyclic AMP phosphodiesterase CpdA